MMHGASRNLPSVAVGYTTRTGGSGVGFGPRKARTLLERMRHRPEIAETRSVGLVKGESIGISLNNKMAKGEL